MTTLLDANVLVFERIREEQRNGRSVWTSVQAGYERALITILDANITTLFAAIILYTLGSGPVKGFAVVLMIGIAGYATLRGLIGPVRLWLLNRLDSSTSGVILVSADEALATAVRLHFRHKRVHKVYNAVVFGRPPAPIQVWRDLLAVETVATSGDLRMPAEGSDKGNTVLGSGVMLPELEAALAGMSAGDEREVDMTFPADWRATELAGKSAKVQLKVHKVSEPHLPEIDEAFVKSFGIKNGKIEQFRKEVRANLERELKGNLMQRLRAEVADQLVAAYESVELPPRLVEAEARNMAANAQQQARQQGQANASFEAAQFKDAAHKRVAAGLLVGEIARQNKLSLDNKRLTETLQLIASTYEDPAQVVELYRNDANLMSGLRNRVMEEQVIDWIAERAKATEKSISFTELMRPAA